MENQRDVSPASRFRRGEGMGETQPPYQAQQGPSAFSALMGGCLNEWIGGYMIASRLVESSDTGATLVG